MSVFRDTYGLQDHAEPIGSTMADLLGVIYSAAYSDRIHPDMMRQARDGEGWLHSGVMCHGILVHGSPLSRTFMVRAFFHGRGHGKVGSLTDVTFGYLLVGDGTRKNRLHGGEDGITSAEDAVARGLAAAEAHATARETKMEIIKMAEPALWTLP